MDKKHIITIAGRPGSGKSTTSKSIAEQLGYGHFSSGDLFRAIGKEQGLDLMDANRAAQGSNDIDRLVDERLEEIGRTQDKLAIDSRLAWHWIPQSFKVFLDLDIEVAARRISANMDPERKQHEHVPDDPKEYAKELQHRLDLESNRYMAKYQVDPYDHANFDLVVDTQANNVEQVVQIVLDAYKKWLEA